MFQRRARSVNTWASTTAPVARGKHADHVRWTSSTRGYCVRNVTALAMVSQRSSHAVRGGRSAVASSTAPARIETNGSVRAQPYAARPGARSDASDERLAGFGGDGYHHGPERHDEHERQQSDVPASGADEEQQRQREPEHGCPCRAARRR